MTADSAIANGSTLPAHYPPGIRWDVEIPPVDLARLLDEAFEKHGPRTAIDFLGKKTSYRDLRKTIDRAAKGLQMAGIKKGDRIGLYMPNSPYYPILFIAAMKIGAVVANFCSLDSEETLRREIARTGTKMMVTLDLNPWHDRVVKLRDEGVLEKIVACRLADALPPAKAALFNLFKSGTLGHAPANAEGYIRFGDLARNDGAFAPVPVSPKEPALLQYTGGSTGKPKSAVLTHENLVANACQIEAYMSAGPGKDAKDGYLKPGDGVVASLPYFHMFGLMLSMIAALKNGLRLLILPDPKDTGAKLRAIKRGKAKLHAELPGLLQMMLESGRVKKGDFDSLSMLVAGGTALRPSLAAAFEKATGGRNILRQGLGMTEASPVMTCNPVAGPVDNETVGLPLPGVSIRITGQDNPTRVLALGETGRIQVKGPNIMQGYYGEPEETAKTFTADGWLDTGDAGYLDENLRLHVTGRFKRMSIINGHNVFHAPIEAAVAAHPAVAECMAIGVKNEQSKAGEAVKIFIRFKPDIEQPDEAALRAFLKDKLGDLEIPKFMEFRKSPLPRNHVGKPDYLALERGETPPPAPPAQTAPQPGI
jgi:long-chain acyl-CoA synthetase